ncbi:tRNA (guanine(10)-N(2))-dimethyltransferase [Candidatus Micrarchaeota archaeon]|nr:tRNA (guanine(10)-N(2))-dimethyltransferase [Candidatus Micrarchaeota archaeon]
MKLQKIREGKAVVWAQPDEVPGASVFYNPRMALNRTLSALALSALSTRLKKRMVLDGFCASGIRGIRYALESGLTDVTFLDLNPDAIALAKKNAKLNKLEKITKPEFVAESFDRFATSGRCFDVVELDPFGTPAPFVANALRLLPRFGVLSVTATDLATLCGSKNRPAKRRYDARPLYVEYGHELALRILAGFVVRQAAMQDIGAKPVFSYYQDHYAKCLFWARRGAQAADGALEKIGFISHCTHCGHRVVGQLEKCVCGKSVQWVGPLWLGDVQDESVLAAMKTTVAATKGDDAKLQAILDLLSGESGLPPYHFDLHKVGRGSVSPKMDAVLAQLKKAGFKAARTHYNPTAVKTDATLANLKRIISES